MILPCSVSREVVDRKARLAGNGLVLVKRRNTASDGFTTHPSGAIQMNQYSVAALEKGKTIPCELRLVLDHLDGSEYDNIILKEY
jgi:hypothetical protein